jgi:hypothetical protein
VGIHGAYNRIDDAGSLLRLRARQAGYTQVLWYRGGQAAGLQVTPRARVGFVY